jgi:hypothetical protein
MRSKYMLLSLFVLLALLSGGAGFALAQASPSTDGPQPQSPPTIYPDVDFSFTYQGLLKENGQPVSGTRDMTFFLSHDSDCSTNFFDLTQTGVQVTDGLFSVELKMQNQVFSGEEAWIQAKVSGTELGCQKVTAVPYAMSLVPGAWVLGEVLGDEMLVVANRSNISGGSGIRASTDAPIGSGIVGIAKSTTGVNHGVVGGTNSPYGYGVYGISPQGGIAVGADGPIHSTADSELYLSPHDLVVRATGTTDPVIPNVNVYPLEGGGVRVANKTGSDLTVYLSLPISTFGTLLGSQVYIKNVYICFASSGATINATAVMKNNNSAFNHSFYMIDSTDRSSNSPGVYSCYYVSDTAPYVAINNSSWVQFNVNMLHFPPIYLDIYTVKLTLTESPN